MTGQGLRTILSSGREWCASCQSYVREKHSATGAGLCNCDLIAMLDVCGLTIEQGIDALKKNDAIRRHVAEMTAHRDAWRSHAERLQRIQRTARHNWFPPQDKLEWEE